MKAYDTFSSWVSAVIGVGLSKRLARSRGPSQAGSWLRHEPATRGDEHAAGSLAERSTVATPRRLGETRRLGFAMGPSDPLVHQREPQVGLRLHGIGPFCHSSSSASSST